MSSGNQRYINTAGTHNITMGDDFINVSTSVGAITLVFPNIRDSGAINLNKVWFVNDVDDMAATNNVTIVASDTSPATELNGGSSVVLDTNGFSAEIVPSGYYNYMVNSGISDGGMTGSGTLNYVAKFTPSGTVLGNSQLFDNGSSVGLGTILPSADTKFHIKGIDNTSNNFSLKIDGLASNTPLLYVRNDGNAFMGNNTPASVVSPISLDLGGQYSNVNGANPKLVIYNSGVGRSGYGVSDNGVGQTELFTLAASQFFDFTWYRGANLAARLGTETLRLVRQDNTVGFGYAVSMALLNSSNSPVVYSTYSARIVDNTAGSEDGELVMFTTTAGAQTEKMIIRHNGTINTPLLPTYADNATAILGGLTTSDIYKTITGELRIVV